MTTTAELDVRLTQVERVAQDAAARVKSNDAAVRGLVARGGVIGPTGPAGADGTDGIDGVNPSALSILALVYPVGCLYFSTNSTNPATSLGFGTWSAFGTGRVPVGFDSGDVNFDTDEETGGAKTVAATGSNSAPTISGSVAAITAGTPAGTNSVPTFTGSALATHSHELPVQLVSGTSTRWLSSATFGTGTSRAAQGQDTAHVADPTSAAVALSQAVSAGTPAGTVSAPVFTGSALGTHLHGAGTLAASAPTFTGSASSVVQPYIVVRMWKRTA